MSQRWGEHFQQFEAFGAFPWEDPRFPKVHSLEDLRIPKPSAGLVTVDQLFEGACRGTKRDPRPVTPIFNDIESHQELEDTVILHLRLLLEEFRYDPNTLLFSVARRALVHPTVAKSGDFQSDLVNGHADEQDLLLSHIEVRAERSLAPVILTDNCLEVLPKKSVGLFACGERTDDDYGFFYGLPQSALQLSAVNLRAFLRRNSLEELTATPCPNFVFSLLALHLMEQRIGADSDSSYQADEYDDEEPEWPTVPFCSYEEAAAAIKEVQPMYLFSPLYRVRYDFGDGERISHLRVNRNSFTGEVYVTEAYQKRNRKG